jgi:hypothetical protein
MTGDQQTSLLVGSREPDDRAAMGLPPRLVDRLPVESREYVGELMDKSPEILVGIVEDESASRPRRFFSGQLLALLGDPRINPDLPAMVDIPAATVSIGLDPRSEDSVLDGCKPDGLQHDWLLTSDGSSCAGAAGRCADPSVVGDHRIGRRFGLRRARLPDPDVSRY